MVAILAGTVKMITLLTSAWPPAAQIFNSATDMYAYYNTTNNTNLSGLERITNIFPQVCYSSFLPMLKLFKTVATVHALIKKKIKFSSYSRKFILEQLQSCIWLTASSYMGNIYAFPHILGSPSSYLTFQLLYSEFLYMRKILFLFISVALMHRHLMHTYIYTAHVLYNIIISVIEMVSMYFSFMVPPVTLYSLFLTSSCEN